MARSLENDPEQSLLDKSDTQSQTPEDEQAVVAGDNDQSLEPTGRPDGTDTRSRTDVAASPVPMELANERAGGEPIDQHRQSRRRIRIRLRRKVERSSEASTGRKSSERRAARGRLSFAGKAFMLAAILSHWLAAAMLLATPAYLAWDYGGVLSWSRWVAASMVLAAGLLAIPMLLNTTVFRIAVTKNAKENQENRAVIHWRVLLVPLLCVIGWGLAWMQTVPVGKTIVSLVSRGSATAYSDWIPDGISQEVIAAAATEPFHRRATNIANGWYPVSVCVELTRTAQAGPAIFALVCLLSAIVFRTRRTVIVMLTVIAISGGVMSFLGISDQIRAPSPSIDNSILNPQSRLGLPFGSFVCRNNAAGYLNLTLAAAVGLLVYFFLKAKERSEGDEKYQIQPENWWDRPIFFLQNALLQIDAATVFALVLVIMNFSGVLASQSRGGTLGVVAGGLITCLLTRSRTSKWWQPIAILLTVGGVAILLGSIGLIEPIRVRLETLWASESPQDGRLGHWADALAAAWYYFPAGAGLGTHRYAYLPYQRHSAGAWFVNADNTSVEWLVEGGAWLLPLAIAGVALVAMSLLRIAGIRKAPHLTALIAAGWFLIGSQLVCQFFDFGILLPSNYVTAAILVGAILGASGRRYRPERLSDPQIAPSMESQNRLAVWGTVLLSCLLVWDAKNVASRNAIAESLRNEVIRTDGIVGPLTLETLNRFADSPDPTLQMAFASKGLAEQAAAGRKTLSAAGSPKGVDVSRDSTVESRRTIYYLGLRPQGALPKEALLEGQSLESILVSRRHAINALMMCPLSDLARYQLVQLGFAAGDSEETVAELLDGWERLRVNFAPALELAARLAAVYPSGDTAARIMRRLLVVDPGRLNSVWPIFPLLIGDRGEIAISELLPDDAQMLVAALERSGAGGAMDAALRDNLIERAEKLIQAELSRGSRLGAGANTAFLAGRLRWIRSDFEEAEPWFKQAVELDPSQTEYRYRWVETLEKLGRKPQAIEQIAICLLQDPGNGKYRNKMRELERRPAGGGR